VFAAVSQDQKEIYLEFIREKEKSGDFLFSMFADSFMKLW
jgi:hypothetical protein